jgi:hypothetical protein
MLAMSTGPTANLDASFADGAWTHGDPTAGRLPRRSPSRALPTLLSRALISP